MPWLEVMRIDSPAVGYAVGEAVRIGLL
jgi:hypothetical protein